MKLFRITSKRGLGTVVTTTILLSAVAVLGIFLVGWSNSNLISHQNILASTFSDKINKLNEQIVFENVWFVTTPPKKVNVTLNNVGTIGLNITEIELVNSTAVTKFTITDGGITPSQIYSLQEDYAWTSGDPIDVIVTTGRDNIYRTEVLPP